MIADDLFAGAGGWDLAAAKLGIHARGVENMKEARATRDAAGLTTIHDDVWTFAPDGNAEGLIASPPCQTFSAAGKGSGRKALDDVLRGIHQHYWSSLDHLRFLGEEVGDNRTALVLTPLHFAMQGGYDWLAWEQVPTVLPVWEACAAELEKHGWHTWTGLLQAEMYGVPQTRKRAFLLASRRGPVAPPTPTHSRYYSRTPDKLDPAVQKWVSMAEALGWGMTRRPYPTVAPGSAAGGGSVMAVGGSGARSLIRAEIEANHWEFRPERLRMTTMPNSAVRSIDAPAPTICFGHDAASARWFAANQEARRITVDEAGQLQAFPAQFPWQGTKARKFMQCGNAVPPGLALHALAAATGVNAEERAA